MTVEVYVDKLKIEMNRFNNLITNYEKTMLNLFNALNQTSSYWQDSNSIKFLDNISSQKISIDKKVTELKTIKEAYKYLIDKYEKFGNKIEYDFEMREVINKNINESIEKINKTINSYNSLYISFHPNERNEIIDQKQQLLIIKSNIEKLKEKIKNAFTEIEEIENNVNSKLSRIHIEIIQEENFKDYV